MIILVSNNSKRKITAQTVTADGLIKKAFIPGINEIDSADFKALSSESFVKHLLDDGLLSTTAADKKRAKEVTKQVNAELDAQAK